MLDVVPSVILSVVLSCIRIRSLPDTVTVSMLLAVDVVCVLEGRRSSETLPCTSIVSTPSDVLYRYELDASVVEYGFDSGS